MTQESNTTPKSMKQAGTSDALTQGLKKALADASLSDEAKLRLYERFNEERARRGESLIRIPADLLARVKAHATAAPEAVRKATQSGKESVTMAASGSMHLAKATGKGGKRFGSKMKRGTVNATRNTADVIKEIGRTVADVGRIVTLESYEVVREIPQSKRKALLAPPKLMGKGVKAGVRMMTGTTKAAAKTVKAGAVITKDATTTTATGMIESARVGKAFAESSGQIMQAGDALASGIKDAAKTVIAPEPDSEKA